MDDVGAGQRLAPRADGELPGEGEATGSRPPRSSGRQAMGRAMNQIQFTNAVSQGGMGDLYSDASRLSSMGVNRLFSEDRQLRLTLIERTVDWTIKASTGNSKSPADSTEIELAAITDGVGEVQSQKSAGQKVEDDSTRRLLPWLVILPHRILKSCIIFVYIVCIASGLLYWFTEPAQELNPPETFIGQMSENRLVISWLLTQSKSQEVFDKYVAFEMSEDLATVVADDAAASMLYFQETSVNIKLWGNCLDVMSNVKIAGDYVSQKRGVGGPGARPYEECQAECVAEGVDYFVWYSQADEGVCECYAVLKANGSDDGFIDYPGHISGATCCSTRPNDCPGFCTVAAVQQRQESQYTVIFDATAQLASGLIGMLQGTCLTHSYKLDISSMAGPFNIISRGPTAPQYNVSVLWYDDFEETFLMQSRPAIFMPIILLTLLVGLFIAGRRVRWRFGKMPLCFWPTILQVLCAGLQADPAVSYEVFTTWISLGRLQHSSTWRLVVRTEVLVYTWCIALYISALYRSLKPRDNWMGLIIVEFIVNSIHVGLIVTLFYELEEDTEFTGVSSRVPVLATQLLGCWVTLFVFGLVTATRYVRLSRLFRRLPYSRCWLQIQVNRFLMLLLNFLFMSTLGVRAMRMIFLGPLQYTATWIGPIRIGSLWKLLHMISAGMILENTTFHADILATTVYTALAAVSMFAFLPRPQQELVADNEGNFTLTDKLNNKKRFPPYMSRKEIKRIRWLTHAARVINKIEKGAPSDYNMLVKEPYDSEEGLRPYFTTLRMVGHPIKNEQFDVLSAILEGKFRGNSVLIVTFRGTKGSKNVMQDLKIAMEPIEDPEDDLWHKRFAQSSADANAVRVRDHEGVRVHCGFQEMLNSVKEEMMQKLIIKLNEMLGRNSHVDVWLVGHSLGGSLATLLAIKVHALLQGLDDIKERCKVGVFTLGSPRVGNSKFAKFFNATGVKCARVINEGDPIPSIMPAIQGCGFRHVGSLIWMSNVGHLRKDPSFLEMSIRSHLSFSGLILYLPGNLVGIASVATSHKIQSYMAGLELAEEKETHGASFETTRYGSTFAGYDINFEEDGWVLDEPVDGHRLGEEVELTDETEHVILADRALAALWGQPAVLLRRGETGLTGSASVQAAASFPAAASASGRPLALDGRLDVMV